MRVFSYSEARKRLAEVLDLAETSEVIITRRNGEAFRLRKLEREASPFDIEGMTLGISTSELVDAVRDSRERRN